MSSQAAEISKWKGRAIKLKVKSKTEMDKPSPPCTPTKRGFPMTSDSSNVLNSPKKFLVTPKKVLDSPMKMLDSPRKMLDSPKKALDSPKSSMLDSPKSRFFGVGGSSEMLFRTCPKQFFDNSSLGTLPGRDPNVSSCPLPLSAALYILKDLSCLFLPEVSQASKTPDQETGNCCKFTRGVNKLGHEGVTGLSGPSRRLRIRASTNKHLRLLL